MAELQKARLELQASLESRAAEHQKQLADTAASGGREAQSQSDALVQDLQGRLETTLRDFQEKDTNAVADQLQKATVDFETCSAQRLEEQAVLTLGRPSEELRALGAAAVGETEQRLASLSQASAESLVRQATAATEECRSHLVDSFEAQARAVEESRTAAVDSVRSAAEAALGGLEKTKQQVENSLGTRTAEFERRMAEMATVLEGLEQRSGIPRAPNGQEREKAQRAAEELRGVTRDLLEHSTRQLQEQSSAIARSVRDELRASVAKLAEETGQQVAQVADATAESLSQQAQAMSKESRDRRWLELSKSRCKWPAEARRL